MNIWWLFGRKNMLWGEAGLVGEGKILIWGFKEGKQRSFLLCE